MNNKNTLVINSIYNVLYRLLNVLFPLVSSAYVARVLLSTGVGKVAVAQNIVAYFTLIAALGIPNYGVRELAKVRDNNNKSNALFSELFIINFTSTLICLITYYLMIVTSSHFKSEIHLYYVVGLSIMFNFFNVDWFYQGQEQYKYIALRSFIIKMVSLISLFLFIRNKSDIVIYALINALAIGGNQIINIINLKKYNISFIFKGLDIKKHLKPVIILLSTTVAIELYTMLDTTMLGFMTKDENVGYYSNSMKIVKILITLVTAIGGVLLPRLSYYREKNMIDECSKVVNQIFSILLFLFIPMQVGIFMLSDDIIMTMFGNSFVGATTTLKIASFLICTLGFSNLFGTQVLLTFNSEKKLFLCTVFGAVVNVVLNAILIPKCLQNGAAIASVISESIVTIMTFIFSLKYIKFVIPKKNLICISISSILMIFVLLLLKAFRLNSILELILSSVIGVFIYFIVNVVMKNPELEFCYKIIKSRKKSQKN